MWFGLNELVVDWSIAWLLKSLIDWLADSFIGWLIDWLVGQLTIAWLILNRLNIPKGIASKQYRQYRNARPPRCAWCVPAWSGKCCSAALCTFLLGVDGQLHADFIWALFLCNMFWNAELNSEKQHLNISLPTVLHCLLLSIHPVVDAILANAKEQEGDEWENVDNHKKEHLSRACGNERQRCAEQKWEGNPQWVRAEEEGGT